MRRGEAGDFEAAEVLGPLFTKPEEGPFTRSKVRPTPIEALVAGIIWRHRGRRNPISIASIITATGMPSLTERKVKEIVEQLRVMHRVPIGARREEPAGYFRIMDREDLQVAVAPYLAQIRAMVRVLRALMTREERAEFMGQMRLEMEGD